MRHGRVLLFLLAMFVLSSASVPAAPPVVVGPGPGIPFPGIGFGFGGPRVGFIIGGYAPLAYPPYPYFSSPVYVQRTTNITIVNPQPAQPAAQPPITVNVNINLAGLDLRDEDYPDKIIIRPGQKAARAKPAEKAEPAEPPLPGQKAGDFKAPRPEDPKRAQPALKEEARPPLPILPDRPVPRADPGRPGEEFIALGKAAFGEREYGRAERRFQQAVGAAPNEPVGHFYLAQAQFALGKYREAVAEIHEGLRLRADWPNSRFRSRELYAAGADFADQLRQLEAALGRNPDDPALLFLCAYQLWFDNREPEARGLFRRALPLVTEPRFIALFLQVQQVGPVALR